ncbi:hypothetical protein [Rhodococcus sp. SORGH_AS_0301]|uniref:hypothetical protein n=1 Tax=Rhodococcus sp. SORGH_AS_0301 TaxID=3041780 RepID=UPI0027D8DA2A|nr:hypothetical protein [Rhodococcus sp. SORGH_AS_0301]
MKRGELGANGPTSDTKRKTGVWKGQPPSAITQALLDVVVVPRRSSRSKLPADKYYLDEMDRARSLHSKWAAAQLDCPNLDENAVVGWIHLTGGTDTFVAIKLANAGITPEDARLRLAYNRLDPTADTIYYRLLNGYMSVKDAANQVKRWKETAPERAAM